ncbi:MAG: hypothetical protein K2H82_03025 [Oscillospiraceae bacterium]|nr:hypothetical protein [Oscillospiraceae bacterium]
MKKLNFKLKKSGIFACALMLVISLGCTGCTNPKQEINMTEDELPYGATMRSDKNSFAVPVTYDRRFVKEEQIVVVADYFAAIQNQDQELYLASALPLYTDYQIQEVYSYQDVGELVEGLHEGIAGQTGEDFTFSMILVNSFSQDTTFGGLEAILDLLDHVDDPDAESGEKFSERMQGAWALELEWNLLYNQHSSSGTVESQWVYLFQVDDQYYCCM